jgi:hypothetical protein
VIAMSFILLAIVYYVVNISELEKCSLKYIHSYAQKVKFEDQSSTLDVLNSLYQRNIPFAALSGNADKSSTVGILFSDQVDFPPIIKGRFFHTTDFFVDKCQAVVGKDVADQIYYDAGSPFIDIGNVKYSVIGITATNVDTPINSCIYYNLDSVTQHSLLFIDARDKQHLVTIISEIKSIGKIVLIDDPISGVSRFMNYTIGYHITICIILVMMIIYIHYSIKLLYFVLKELLETEFIIGKSVLYLSKKMSIYVFFSSIFAILISHILIRLALSSSLFNQILIGQIPFYSTIIVLLMGLMIPSVAYAFFYTRKHIRGGVY